MNLVRLLIMMISVLSVPVFANSQSADANEDQDTITLYASGATTTAPTEGEEGADAEGEEEDEEEGEEQAEGSGGE